MRKFTCSIFVLCSSLWFTGAYAQVNQVENDGSLRLMDGYGNPITSTGNRLDVTVSGGGGDGAILDGVSGSIKATVFDYANSNPLGVVLRDTNGDYVSVGGGTQYNQGTRTTDTDTLSMVGCVRADTPAVATGVIDGDRARCIVDATGRLWAHIGAVDGTVAVTQSGAWNITNISGTVSLPTGAATAALQDGIIKDGAGDTTQANVSSGRLHVDGSGVTQPISGTVTVTDGAGALNVIVDSGTLAATQSGTWNITNISGTISLPTGAATAANQDGIIRDGTGDTTQANVSGGRLHVDGSGVTQPISGTVTANAGSGTFTVSGTTFDGILRDGTGDTTQANVTSGRLQVDGSGVTQPVSGTVTVTDGAGALNVIVDSGTITIGTFPDNEPFNVAQINGVAPAAHDALMSGDSVPLTIACFSETPEDSDANTNANRTSADADKGRVTCTRNGEVFIREGGVHKWTYHENSSSALTDTTVHAACGSGLFNYITAVTFSIGGATAASILIEDSTTTAILGPYYLEGVAGRGLHVTFPGGKKQTTANTLVSVTTTGAVAHGLDIQGFCAA